MSQHMPAVNDEMAKRFSVSLTRVEVKQTGTNTNLQFTLTGHEMAIAAAAGMMKALPDDSPLKRHLAETENNGRALVITVPVQVDEKHPTIHQKNIQLAQALHELTNCRLGYVNIQPGAHREAANASEQDSYVPMVNVFAQHDRSDRNNQAGIYAAEIIRAQLTPSLTQEYYGNILSMRQDKAVKLIADPRNPQKHVRLLGMSTQLQSERDAKLSADKLATQLEQAYQVFHPKTMHLMLSGVEIKALDDHHHKKMGAFMHVQEASFGAKREPNANDPTHVTILTLVGGEADVEKAEKSLEHLFPRKRFKIERHGEELKLMLAGDSLTDAAKLVAAVQQQTQCTLPMDIHATTSKAQQQPGQFSPCLETEVWDDVAKSQRVDTNNALGGYVGLQFPSHSLILPEMALAMQKPPRARVVVHEELPSQPEAQKAADDYKEGVEARMRRRQAISLS